MDPSSDCCTLALVVAQRNFFDLRLVVATYTVAVGRAFVAVAGPLASDTGPFDVFVASFAA